MKKTGRGDVVGGKVWLQVKGRVAWKDSGCGGRSGNVGGLDGQWVEG